jgi:hypothetical protein
MDTSQINQIAEVIKTLNLNVDSKTLEIVMVQLKSLLFWKFVIFPIIDDLNILVSFAIIGFTVYKIFKYNIDHNNI